jgi:predicted Zn-dependent peptidase
MSDEPLAPEPPRRNPFRSPSLIGAIAFVGGMAVTLGAVQLGGGFSPRTPAPPAAAVKITPAPAPSAIPALPPGTDIATLAAREQALAGRLDQLDLRIRDVDGSARAASSYATQAERLMIAFAVRRAVERGEPLGTLENQLRARFAEGQGDSVAAIVQAAAQPVTIEDLRFELEKVALQLNNGPNDSLWARARRMLGDLVVLRSEDSPSPRASDRLNRARSALDRSDVEAALAEVAHMPGAANAQSWTGAARRYVAARRALTEIERAAMETSPAVPAPAG